MSRGAARRALLACASATMLALAGAVHAAGDEAAAEGARADIGQETGSEKPAWQRKLDRFLDAIGIKTGPEATGSWADDMPECLKAQAAGYPVGCGAVD